MKIKNIIIIILLTFISCGGDILVEENDDSGTGSGSKIYIVGGLSSISIGSVVPGIDIYYPDTDSWEYSITGIPVPVSFAGVTEYDGKIYIIGGFNNLGTVVNIVQIYDIATNSWTAGTPMSESRANHSAVALNGKIYITRGTTANASIAWTVGSLTNTLIYNIADNSWSPNATGVADLAYSNKSVAVFDNVIYYTGGKSLTSTLQAAHDGIIISNNTTTNSITEWNLTNGVTTTATVRVGHSALFASIDSITYHFVIGGFSALTNTGCYVFNIATGSAPVSPAASVFQYLRYPFANTTSNNWSNVNTGVSLSGTGFGSAVASGNKIYYFGGASSEISGGSQLVYSYDLKDFPNGNWITKTNMPTPRFGHTAIVLE
ncbi:MAG: hypothetical protein CVV49_14585 [Spirochaetae bacterium HGW-Spirochaetae-5]|nr:MAG: hypothetical protein CVV49_14585 [Spirochaetae bacterium HGW-Spirochaetae-5]